LEVDGSISVILIMRAVGPVRQDGAVFGVGRTEWDTSEWRTRMIGMRSRRRVMTAVFGMQAVLVAGSGQVAVAH
jgi:hypothetical protein